jgi:hypothetical protein
MVEKLRIKVYIRLFIYSDKKEFDEYIVKPNLNQRKFLTDTFLISLFILLYSRTTNANRVIDCDSSQTSICFQQSLHRRRLTLILPETVVKIPKYFRHLRHVHFRWFVEKRDWRAIQSQVWCFVFTIN